jgi:hypothetical protein
MLQFFISTYMLLILAVKEHGWQEQQDESEVYFSFDFQ